MIASLVSALAFASPAQALGLTFNWSFNATGNNDTGATLGTVSGTISGLQDNTTHGVGSGITATVLSTPDRQNEGITFVTPRYGTITVAGGVVTLSDLTFYEDISGNSLSLATSFGNYTLNSSGYELSNITSGTTFSAATPVPFDFDPSFGLVALGGIWAGRKVIKKIKTAKKSV